MMAVWSEGQTIYLNIWLLAENRDLGLWNIENLVSNFQLLFFCFVLFCDTQMETGDRCVGYMGHRDESLEPLHFLGPLLSHGMGSQVEI